MNFVNRILIVPLECLSCLGMPVGQISDKIVYFGVGGGCIIGGLFLLFAHQAEIDIASKTKQTATSGRLAIRKYYRRSTISTMITLLGCLIIGWLWVTNGYVAAGFLAAILILVLAICILGMVDLLAVSMQQFAGNKKKPDRGALEKLVQDHQQKNQDEGSISSCDDTRRN